MWLTLAFCSAFMLGFYDVFKKKALHHNAVIPVLFLNTLFSSILFAPFIILSSRGYLPASLFYVPECTFHEHLLITLKSVIVLTSWIFGYFGIKHLPITIVGPINATRPVMVLVGAMVIFGERLNTYQWIGVTLAFLSFIMLSRSGKKEGIDFKSNKWIYFVFVAAATGAVSGLYDKYLMTRLAPMAVQSWFNVYQMVMMGAVMLLLWYPKRKNTTPFKWNWCILLVTLFLAAADFAYFFALSEQDSLISVVSMIRRGSVIVSFTVGAFVFREKNLRSKAIDLALVLVGMIFLYMGTK